jgi:hypothetical protein
MAEYVVLVLFLVLAVTAADVSRHGIVGKRLKLQCMMLKLLRS